MAANRNWNIIFGIIGLLLIIGAGYTHLELKEEIQRYLILYACATLLTLLIWKSIVSTMLFYIILGVILYMNFFFLSLLIIDLFTPRHNYIEGEHGGMSMAWMWGVVAGFTLSPISLVLYHQLEKRNRKFEIAFVLVYIIVSAVVYFY